MLLLMILIAELQKQYLGLGLKVLRYVLCKLLGTIIKVHKATKSHKSRGSLYRSW